MTEKTEMQVMEEKYKKLLAERQALLSTYKGKNDPALVREFIENKLLQESENDDPKIRLKATELLGKLTDVAAFTDRKRIEVSDESSDKLKAMFQKKLEEVLGKTINGEVVDD